MNHNFYFTYSDINLKFLLRRECKGFNDTIMIETPFKETTRDGKDVIRFVQLAVTSSTFVIAPGKDEVSPTRTSSQCCDTDVQELLLLYPWHSIKLFVFKKSKRKCIKALFLDKTMRYFEMQEIPKVKIHWYLWCRYIIEMHNAKRIWPFFDVANMNNKNKVWETKCIKICFTKRKHKIYARPTWTDKYLYLGPVREAEDQIRPSPIPGLGKSEDIKLYYLKPRYFGCWEQSEHWVQCGESSLEFMHDDDD